MDHLNSTDNFRFMVNNCPDYASFVTWGINYGFNKEMTNKVLILLRGVSGAGKSTFAKFLIDNFKETPTHHEADMWMMKDGVYDFNPNNLGYCHAQCILSTERDMQVDIPFIIVSNTFTTQKELNPYLSLAEKYQYKVISLVVENRNNTQSVHSVPKEVLDSQAARLHRSIKLLPL